MNHRLASLAAQSWNEKCEVGRHDHGNQVDYTELDANDEHRIALEEGSPSWVVASLET